jgi:hypothetical protein
MQDLPESAELLFTDASGIYIPQRFATEIIREYVHEVSSEEWAILEAGPDHEWYWETWSDVEQNAEVWVPIQFTPNTVKVHKLYQDGDLWMVPEDAEWPEDD